MHFVPDVLGLAFDFAALTVSPRLHLNPTPQPNASFFCRSHEALADGFNPETNNRVPGPNQARVLAGFALSTTFLAQLGLDFWVDLYYLAPGPLA